MAATAYTKTTGSWYFVDGLDVRSAAASGTIVAFGDSITDGFQSLASGNARWPNYLARRLTALEGPHAPGVVDEGISGNRILSPSGCFGVSAEDRFARDALGQPGVRAVAEATAAADRPAAAASAQATGTSPEAIGRDRFFGLAASARGQGPRRGQCPGKKKPRRPVLLRTDGAGTEKRPNNRGRCLGRSERRQRVWLHDRQPYFNARRPSVKSQGRFFMGPAKAGS